MRWSGGSRRYLDIAGAQRCGPAAPPLMPEVLSVKEGDEKYCGCPVLDPVVTAKLLPTTPTTLLVRVRVEPLAVAVTGELALLLNTWANALATSVAVLLLLCQSLPE